MNEDYSTKQHTAKERYEKLKEKREQYLDRARECSELTIPALIPEDGFHYTSVSLGWEDMVLQFEEHLLF